MSGLVCLESWIKGFSVLFTLATFNRKIQVQMWA